LDICWIHQQVTQSFNYSSLVCKGTRGTHFFVTEYGLEFPASNAKTCPAPSNCIINVAQQAAGMRAAFQAFEKVGTVEHALWYDYRFSFLP
jgi:hypothetical protein